ncbi:MAG: glucosaminidase domain-containing protein [Bacteroidetes bacterium]|nr:glucosaminidase domain-containing protein [Bacteroidota bacterium]
MKKIILISLVSFFSGGLVIVQAQPNLRSDTGRITPELYIEMFKDAAISDMMKTGVPSSITLAQGMYESDYGNSPLAKGANNHFGIKCHKEWSGDTFHKDDDAPNECFRKYENVMQSYDDHSDFLRSRDRYHFLFDLEITDYKGWSHGLKKAGYATNPSYASKIIGIIEKYNLSEFDLQGVKVPITAEKVDAPVKPIQKKTEIKSVKTNTNQKTSSTDANTVNGVPFVYAREGDTWTKISSDHGIELWQVLEFNDADKNDILEVGNIVFIKAKKNKSTTFTHILKEGETMHDISQQYGVKLSKLYKMNQLQPGAIVTAGTKVYLKRAMLFGIVL